MITLEEFSRRILEPAAAEFAAKFAIEEEARASAAWAATFGRGAVAMWNGPLPQLKPMVFRVSLPASPFWRTPIRLPEEDAG